MECPRTPGAGISGANVLLGGSDIRILPDRPYSNQARSQRAQLLDRFADAAGILNAPKLKPMLRESCPRPLCGSAYSFVVARPGVDSPVQAMALGICTHRAIEVEEIKIKAVEGLQAIWPDIRQITVTNPGSHYETEGDIGAAASRETG